MALQRMFSNAVMLGYSPGFSTSAPIRTAPALVELSGASPDASMEGRSNSSTSPAVGRIMPQIIFMVVDLPAPLRPTKP